MPRKEFQVHLLNESGIQKAVRLAERFTDFLNDIEQDTGAEGREVSIVRTKLEEASFFAKKAIACRPENQKV